MNNILFKETDMPTPEQWKQFAEMQNRYRYGQPTPEPRMLVNRPIDSSAEQIARPAPLPARTMPTSPTSGVPGWLTLLALDNRGLSAGEAGDIARYRSSGNPQDSNLAEARKNIAEMVASRQNMRQESAESRGRDPYDRLMELGLKGVPVPNSSPGFRGYNTSTEPRPAPTPLEAGPMPVTPKLTSLGNGYGVTGSNTSGRAGYTNKTYYGPDANVVASGLSSATGRGGFVGAETDAQAAKALQDRAEQNQAAQFNINSMNRGAEAERDLRATKLGVSRGVLDRMEGRNDTEAAVAAAAAQSATSNQSNPFSMPGDNFYDTRSRQATYDNAVQQALAGNKQEQKGAAATLTALNDFREKNLAAQVTQGKGSIDPIDMNKFLLDQQRFNYQQQNDANKFLLDKERFNYQQGLDKERLAVDRSEAEGKQAERQLARQKYMDESRKAFANEFTFSDPKAPREQIAGAVFDISQATGIPLDVVSQFYEQAVKDLKIDYSKGGPKDPMALNKLVAARITQAYRGK